MSRCTSPGPRRGAIAAAVCAAGVALALVTAQPAAATDCTKYASRTGSDTNSGSATSPFKTAQKLVSSLSAGQTGCLGGGTYDETSNGYVLRYPRAGSSGAPITITSVPGQRARLVGIVEVPSGSNWVALTDVDVEGTGGMNTVKIYSSDVVIARNSITNANRGLSCMILGNNSGGGQAVRPLIKENRFSECGSPLNGNKDHGIYAANVVDGQIVDNEILTPAAYALQLYPNAQHTEVAHNVIDGTGSVRGGIVFAGDTTYASNNNTVEDNIITYPATYAITSNWGGAVGTGNVARNNCVWGSGTLISSPKGFTASGNLTADPQFLDRPVDYRLESTSPCLPLVQFDTVAMIDADTSTQTSSPTPSPSPTPNAAPTVSWTAPGNGATVAGSLSAAAGTCAVAAADDVSVDRVEFFVDGAPLGTDTTAPYGCNWDTTTVPNGTHTLKAVAYDGAGSSTAATIQVNVANAAVNQPPTVKLTSPVDGSTFKRTLELAADASDDGRIVKVEFYVDGKYAATETTAPYHQYWSGKYLSYGPHQVTAKAYDDKGLTTTTPPVTVTRVR